MLPRCLSIQIRNYPIERLYALLDKAPLFHQSDGIVKAKFTAQTSAHSFPKPVFRQ
jgi:hypothetical protein